MFQKRNNIAFYDIIVSMKNRTGINIRKWCMTYETCIGEKLSSDMSEADINDAAGLHEKRLAWLMHERLIHLIVMCLTAVLVMFSITLILFLPDTILFSGAMFVISFILLAFYIRHYFFLENTVQRWYVIDEQLQSLLSGK